MVGGVVVSGAGFGLMDAVALISLALLALLWRPDQGRSRRSDVAAAKYTTDPLDLAEDADAEYVGPGQAAVALALLDPPATGELADGVDADLALFGPETQSPPDSGDAAALATLNLRGGAGNTPLPLAPNLRWILIAVAALVAVIPFILRLLS